MNATDRTSTGGRPLRFRGRRVSSGFPGGVWRTYDTCDDPFHTRGRDRRADPPPGYRDAFDADAAPVTGPPRVVPPNRRAVRARRHWANQSKERRRWVSTTSPTRPTHPGPVSSPLFGARSTRRSPGHRR